MTLIIFYSCSEEKKKEYKVEDYHYVLQQKCPNSKYNIYGYRRTVGNTAFSYDVYNVEIQKSEKPFKEQNGFKINGKISKWISNDTLEIFRFKSNTDSKQPKDTLSKITYEKVYDLTLKVVNYDRITGGGMNEYFFDEFKIDSKKIQFYGIERILGPILGNTIEYSLGNIEVVSKQDTIVKICVERIKTGMNGQYQNSDGSVTENIPQIMTKSIRFYPTKKILTSDLKNKVWIFYKI